jgi:hypothetical protein
MPVDGLERMIFFFVVVLLSLSEQINGPNEIMYCLIFKRKKGMPKFKNAH